MAKATRAKITVHDVAAKAGVSIATVSRAFSIPDVVRTDVRKHVLDVARKLGYSPNPAAKALRLQKTHIVGAVIPTLDYAIFAKMINSFQDTLASFDYMTIVLTVGFDNTNIFDKIKLLVDRGAEALLIVGAVEDPALRRYLKTTRVPVLTTYSYLPEEVVPSIGFDNYAATESAMDYLIGLGHKNFAMIAGSTVGNDRQRARIQAYTDALKSRNLRGEERVFIRPYSIAGGAAAMQEIHKLHPTVTAIVCNADFLALGALAECKRLGLHVPNDISVTGFDDYDYSCLLEPPLTTISVPGSEMGIQAALALHSALTTGKKLVSQRLDTKLMVRHSASRPN